MFRKNWIIIFGVILLAGNCFAADPLAIISSVNGSVEVFKGGSGPSVPAQISMSLFPGDVVKTGDESKASILFSDGRITKIPPKGSLALDVPKGESSSLVSKLLSRIKIFGKGGEDEVLGVAATTREKFDRDFSILFPRNCSVADLSPVFTWQEVQGVEGPFEISIMGSSGVLPKFSTSQLSLNLKEEGKELKPDSVYILKVSVNTTAGVFSDECFIQTSSEKTMKDYKGLKNEVLAFVKENPEDDTSLLLLAKVAEENQIYDDAVKFYLKLKKSYPELEERVKIISGKVKLNPELVLKK